MGLPSNRADFLRRETTSALICLPFLDTDMPEEREFADRVLAERGYPRLAVLGLRVLAGIGLWYQLVAWEDLHLDLYDVLAGYGALLLVCSLPAFLFSRAWGSSLLASSALLLLIAWLGWRRFRRKSGLGRDST